MKGTSNSLRLQLDGRLQREILSPLSIDSTGLPMFQLAGCHLWPLGYHGKSKKMAYLEDRALLGAESTREYNVETKHHNHIEPPYI
jgi:hypothetical protein